VNWPNSTDDPPAERADREEGALRLRRFRDGDLEALHRIDQSCFPVGIAYSLRELENFIRRPDTSTWVAEADGNIVGFVVADCERRDAGHIITLDVKKDWRHGGVGTTLMNAAEAWVRQRGAQFMYLETAEYNTTAQNFYRRRGYQKLRGLENYYGKGATAWLMAKRFADWHAR
jgi:[ribosomal protein S18]-alanine N-acetyltransferase